jgi:type I restriction enzyme S subunit
MTVEMKTEFKHTEVGIIPEEWEIYSIKKLKEQGAIIEFQDGNHGELYPRKSDFSEKGRPFLTANLIRDGQVFVNQAPKLPEQYCKKLRIGFARPGDVLLTHNATVGRVAVLPEHAGDCIVGTSITYYRLNLKKIDNRYLSYFMSSSYFQSQLRAVMAQTTRNQVPITSQANLFVVLPPISVQQALARIISTLDSKIALNQKTNESLEAICRAIFRHWFIGFEFPNDEGKPYKSSGGQMIESELGEIPKDWQISTVGKEVEVGGGTTPDTSEPAYWNDGRIPWTTPKDMAGLSSPILLDTTRKITQLGLAAIGGRLYPKGTLLLSSRAPIGYLAISDVATAVNQGMIAAVAEKTVSRYYMLEWCHANLEEIESRANGTTFLEISKSNFREISMIVPTPSLMKRFSVLADSIYSLLLSNSRQSAVLREIRNSLLPKLVSGRIKVPVEVR